MVIHKPKMTSAVISDMIRLEVIVIPANETVQCSLQKLQ